jgi:hypothetical protein
MAPPNNIFILMLPPEKTTETTEWKNRARLKAVHAMYPSLPIVGCLSANGWILRNDFNYSKY